MGGLSFDWKGKEYNIMMEGGCCLFDNDEEEKAFMQWRVTDEGKLYKRYITSSQINPLLRYITTHSYY